MKHIILILTGLVIILSSIGCISNSASSAVIQVNSAEELINAIGPNRTIQLSAGDYMLSDVDDRYMKYLRWDPEFDGNTITIRNVKNLKIIGAQDQVTRLLVYPRYVYVLNFEGCQGVTLENLTLGHFPEAGNCASGVIGATKCSSLAVRHCDLFGCGTEGLSLEEVKGVIFHDSIIRDCTYGIMTLKSCRNLNFTQSTFTRNKEFWAVNIHDSQDVAFTDCHFTHNQARGEAFFSIVSSSDVLIKECHFADNNIDTIANIKKAVIIDNTEGTQPGR